MTAGEIRKELEETYKSPEWYLGFEVGNSTGANCSRHADAVAINAYPSKGFETRGFEIKVSKQDLAAELKNGLKSDEIARFCDYWFLVVPKGLADNFTLPPTWGVIECHDGKLRQKVRATKLESIAPTAGFLCAMLRARERTVFDEAAKISAEREKQIERYAEQQAGRDSEQLRQLVEKLAEIKSATGISLDNWTPTADIIAKLNAARSLDVIVRNVRFVESAAKALLKDAQEIQAAAEAMKMSDLVDGG